MSRDKIYCDDCAEHLPEGEQFYVSELPVNIDSANKGESAVLCGGCYDEHIVEPNKRPHPPVAKAGVQE